MQNTPDSKKQYFLKALKHAAINSRVINIQVMVLLITMSKKDLTKEFMGKNVFDRS